MASALLVCARPGFAADKRPLVIKAAIVYNFTGFANWVDSDRKAPLNICVSEDADIAAALQAISAAQSNSSKPVVMLLTRERLNECDFAYLSKSATQSEFPAQLLEIGAVTISSERGFTDIGIIELIQVGRQHRFEINNTLATNAGIELSSRLLRIAIRVH